MNNAVDIQLLCGCRRQAGCCVVLRCHLMHLWIFQHGDHKLQDQEQSRRTTTKTDFLANVNSRSRSLLCHRPSVRYYVIVLPSVVCRLSSVTFVHPTQAIEIFGNFSTSCGTLAIHDLCLKNLRRPSQGNPFVGGLNPRVVAKYSDFGPFEGCISETMQDMI